MLNTHPTLQARVMSLFCMNHTQHISVKYFVRWTLGTLIRSGKGSLLLVLMHRHLHIFPVWYSDGLGQKWNAVCKKQLINQINEYILSNNVENDFKSVNIAL